jgi:DNA-binding NarL/FixJ family response regulator
MKITTAIIEDDAETRAMFARWLRMAEGFECVGDYGDAESALADLPDLRPEVILTDINLPGINGTELVRQLKPRMPGTQFLMITVYEDGDHIFAALAAGASGYLLKRTARDAMLDAIREVHAGGSPMTASIARKVVQTFQRPEPAEGAGCALSPRESEVLHLLAGGYLYKEVAEALQLSVPTVNTYVRRIYEKLNVRSRAQAVAKMQGGR